MPCLHHTTVLSCSLMYSQSVRIAFSVIHRRGVVCQAVKTHPLYTYSAVRLLAGKRPLNKYPHICHTALSLFKKISHLLPNFITPSCVDHLFSYLSSYIYQKFNADTPKHHACDNVSRDHAPVSELAGSETLDSRLRRRWHIHSNLIQDSSAMPACIITAFDIPQEAPYAVE